MYERECVYVCVGTCTCFCEGYSSDIHFLALRFVYIKQLSVLILMHSFHFSFNTVCMYERECVCVCVCVCAYIQL